MLEALQSKKLTIFNQPVGPIWRVICKININEWIVDSFNLPGMGHVPWNNQENCFFHNALSKTSILNIPKYYKEKNPNKQKQSRTMLFIHAPGGTTPIPSSTSKSEMSLSLIGRDPAQQ